jgi:deazaflavin-dependent oxidoreductase (nitroreductase family)
MEHNIATPHNPTRNPSLVQRLAIATMGLARPLAGRRLLPLYALIEHRGRKSGTAFRTPIVARRTDTGFVLPVPFGPETNWVRNVLAAGEATIAWKGGSYRVTAPRVVDLATASPWLAAPIRGAAKRLGIVSWLEVRDATS